MRGLHNEVGGGLVLGVTAVLAVAPEMPLRPLWPSLCALILVLGTRRIALSLIGGALAGGLLLAEGRFWGVPLALVDDHLLPAFASPWKSGALIFTLVLGGFVHLLERGRILQAAFQRLLHGSSARKVETGAALFGLVCFFDGLANSLMVGRIFQPLSRTAGVNRLRLAYIVDTTSAAVACLAFISTWIAFQLAMIREGFALAGREGEASAYGLFFRSLPHNFYAWFALLLMAVAIVRQWNLGPMKAAVRDAAEEPGKDDGATPPPTPSAGLWRVWVPLAVLLTVTFGGIYADGTARQEVPFWPLRMENLALAFAEARVPAVLVVASALAAFAAWLFFPREKEGTGPTGGEVFLEGMQQLFGPVLILLAAWTLSSTLGDLETAAYLSEALGGQLPFWLLPGAVFLTGAVVAFMTGTSWGTMGLLMPLAIPLAFTVAGGADSALAAGIPMIIGAVFSGAVFGDHCSPFSDTTLVSSVACGVDPVDHVRTQLPYALLAGTAALVLGFLPAALLDGSPFWLPAGALVFGAICVTAARRI